MQRTEPAVRPALLIGGVVGVFGYGVAGYVLFGFGIIDAAYMTALALTTAGFNPVGSLTPGEKAFTISIAVFGVSLFLIILAVVTSAITEGHLGIAARRRRMQKQISDLEDHYIVCAYGRVGRAVARELESEGVSFVVVDSKEELEEVMRADGVLHIVADPTQEAILRRCGIERARGLICALDSDAGNVYIALTARAIKPDLFVVARASDPSSPEPLYRAGADRVISPYVSSGRHMALLALRPRVVDYLDVAGLGENRVRLEEVLIEAGSPFAGATVAEVCGEAIPLLIRRNAGHLIASPEGGERLEAGDLVVIVGEPRTLRPVEG